MRKMERVAKEALSVMFIYLFLPCLGGALASAQTETVLHNFAGSDGALPVSGFIYDKTTGTFYGTTADGGPHGYGTIFELIPDGSGGWTENVLYNFSGPDGDEPDYGLLATYKNGEISALYGTTYFGGQYNYGTVFRVDSGSGWYMDGVCPLQFFVWR